MRGWLRDFGYTLEGGILRKTVEKSKHQLRHPPAWAIQKIIIETYRAEIERIEINDIERGAVFSVSLANFLAACEELDRQHGSQYFLQLRYWERKQQGAVEIKQARLF